MEIAQLTPNWRNQVRETIEFNTEITTSENGVEQRWANRIYPRRTVNYVALSLKDDFQEFVTELTETFGDLVQIHDPVEHSACVILTSEAGSTTIHLDSSVVPGDYVIVGGEYPITVTITAVSGAGAFSTAYDDDYDTVGSSSGMKAATISTPLPIDIPAGSSLHPLLSGYFGQEHQYLSRISTVFEPTVDFLQQPETVELVNCDLPQHGDGRYILNMLPDWASGIRKQVHTPYDSVDYGGVIKNFRKYLSPYYQQSLDYLEGTRPDIRTIKGLFYQMKGQRGSFWCPSFLCDLTPLSGMSAGGNSITVKSSPLLHSPYDYGVTIFLSDGRSVFLEINSVTAGGVAEGAFSSAYDEDYDTVGASNGNSTITFNGTSPFAFTKNDILMVSITRISRFASDSLTVQWYASYAAKMRLNIRTCRD